MKNVLSNLWDSAWKIVGHVWAAFENWAQAREKDLLPSIIAHRKTWVPVMSAIQEIFNKRISDDVKSSINIGGNNATIEEFNRIIQELTKLAHPVYPNNPISQDEGTRRSIRTEALKDTIKLSMVVAYRESLNKISSVDGDERERVRLAFIEAISLSRLFTQKEIKESFLEKNPSV
jgi:hypothetical protein